MPRESASLLVSRGGHVCPAFRAISRLASPRALAGAPITATTAAAASRDLEKGACRELCEARLEPLAQGIRRLFSSNTLRDGQCNKCSERMLERQ